MIFLDRDIDALIRFWDDNLIRQKLFVPKSRQLKKLLKQLKDKSAWTDSSGKGDITPDFYSDKYQLMMDVMTVNDTERKGKKGKKYNPTKQKERELYYKYHLNNVPKDSTVIITADSGLPTHEDHNYTFYKNNFSSTITKHISQINTYRNNHKGYKLIFFIYDESTEYFVNKGTEIKQGEQLKGKRYSCYADKAFLENFKDANIDYVVWYTPYKYVNHKWGFMFRVNKKVAIYDMSIFNKLKFAEYKESEMESTEV